MKDVGNKEFKLKSKVVKFAMFSSLPTAYKHYQSGYWLTLYVR